MSCLFNKISSSCGNDFISTATCNAAAAASCGGSRAFKIAVNAVSSVGGSIAESAVSSVGGSIAESASSAVVGLALPAVQINPTLVHDTLVHDIDTANTKSTAAGGKDYNAAVVNADVVNAAFVNAAAAASDGGCHAFNKAVDVASSLAGSVIKTTSVAVASAPPAVQKIATLIPGMVTATTQTAGTGIGGNDFTSAAACNAEAAAAAEAFSGDDGDLTFLAASKLTTLISGIAGIDAANVKTTSGQGNVTVNDAAVAASDGGCHAFNKAVDVASSLAGSVIKTTSVAVVIILD